MGLKGCCRSLHFWGFRTRAVMRAQSQPRTLGAPAREAENTPTYSWSPDERPPETRIVTSLVRQRPLGSRDFLFFFFSLHQTPRPGWLLESPWWSRGSEGITRCSPGPLPRVTLRSLPRRLGQGHAKPVTRCIRYNIPASPLFKSYRYTSF